jgi:hypothetical protein
MWLKSRSGLNWSTPRTNRSYQREDSFLKGREPDVSQQLSRVEEVSLLWARKRLRFVWRVTSFQLTTISIPTEKSVNTVCNHLEGHPTIYQRREIWAVESAEVERGNLRDAVPAKERMVEV